MKLRHVACRLTQSEASVVSVLANEAVDDHSEMLMDAALVQAPHQPLAGFQIAFVDSSGSRRQEPLATGWASRFELGRPAKSFPSRQGQRNFPGLWWSATTGQHVGFESWLEREHVMLLDFDPAVVAIGIRRASVEIAPVERHADKRMQDQVAASLGSRGGCVTGNGEHALKNGLVWPGRRAGRVQGDQVVLFR